MQQSLESVWYGHRTGTFLRPLSLLYGGMQRARSAMYRAGALRSIHPGQPVIVVGNLTVGGTGKTPLVQWLANELDTAGRRVGIVSRGYGRAGGGVRTVDADTTWREVGDEPLLLARRTHASVVVGRNRVAAARQLVALGADVIVADDGLQHLHLARDCEIVVIDAARMFGNGRLLPAGPLREPVSRLASVHAIVVNGGAPNALLDLPVAASVPVFGMSLEPHSVLQLDGRGPDEPLASYRGHTVHAVAGIGNPSRFFAMLRDHGLHTIEHAFPDHHALAPADVRFGDALPVLMTEKDAVKCARFGNPSLYSVQASAQLAADDADRLLDRILQRVKQVPGYERSS
jgi:tetraacyldisaccharide 4'-kinase